MVYNVQYLLAPGGLSSTILHRGELTTPPCGIILTVCIIIYPLMIEVYIDGACPNNSAEGLQPSAWGFVVLKDGEEIYQHGESAGYGTNNTAEYLALINALEWLAYHFPTENIVIYSDSQLVVNQINGTYEVKSENLFPLWHHAILLLNDFNPGQVKVVWIPRENNKAHNLAESAFISG